MIVVLISMGLSQNARFRDTAQVAEAGEHPPGAWLAHLLQEHLPHYGWNVLESGNWRDSGWYVSIRRGLSRLSIVVAHIEECEWMVQIAPLSVPGILATLFGRKRSASAEDVFRLARDVHVLLRDTVRSQEIMWRWDGYPDESSTREPRPC
jgi:hypothetical protein